MSTAHDIFSEELGRWTTPEEMTTLAGEIKSEEMNAVEELRQYDTYDVEFGKLVTAAITELEDENKRLNSLLDEIFYEFTGDMRDDAWDGVMEWLQKDHPDLALRWTEK